MLLITRRSGEAIVINGTIEVKVLEVKSGRVKLGFEYPAGSSVFRGELFAKIQEENKAAALSSPAGNQLLGEVVRNLHLTGKGPGTPADAQPDQPNLKDAGNDHPTTSDGTGKPTSTKR